MATSGYGQTLTSVYWSEAFLLSGAQGCVANASSWRVTRVAGFRRVQVAAGTGFAAGIKEERTGVSFVDLPQPRDPVTGQPSTTLGQWFLIVATYARDGESGSVQFEAVAGATTSRDRPARAPSTWPTLRRTATVFQQPIAWSWVHPTDFSVTRDVDLRRLPGNRPVQFESTSKRIRRRSDDPGAGNSNALGSTAGGVLTYTFTDMPAGDYNVDVSWVVSADPATIGIVQIVANGVTLGGTFQSDLTGNVFPRSTTRQFTHPGGDLAFDLLLSAATGGAIYRDGTQVTITPHPW